MKTQNPYRPNRMADLPCEDLLLIAATSDIAEWHGFTTNTWGKAGDTWEQAVSVVSAMEASNLVLAANQCLLYARSLPQRKAVEVAEKVIDKVKE